MYSPSNGNGNGNGNGHGHTEEHVAGQSGEAMPASPRESRLGVGTDLGNLEKARSTAYGEGGMLPLADGYAPEDIVSLRHINMEYLERTDIFEFETTLLDPGLATDALGLILGIASMMSAAATFASDVPRQVVESTGKEQFNVLTTILTFFPMIYSPLLLLIYHSKRAKDAYHEYLNYLVIVDFPGSAAWVYLITHAQPVIFLLITIAYSAFSGILFLYYGASMSIYIIFYKQLLFDVVMMWLGLQSIEDSVVTLSEFVEMCDDRDGDPVIDGYTTARAAAAVLKLRPAASQASYKAYADKFAPSGKLKQMTWRRYAIRGLIVLAMAVICGAGFLQFTLDNQGEAESAWETGNKCMRVCFDASNRNKDRCYSCACSCASAMDVPFDPVSCNKYFNVPGCETQTTCNSDQECTANAD